MPHRLGDGKGFLVGAIVQGELPCAFALEDGTPRAPIVFGTDEDHTLAAFALRGFVFAEYP